MPTGMLVRGPTLNFIFGSMTAKTVTFISLIICRVTVIVKGEICSKLGETANCSFGFPKVPIADIVHVSYTGVTQSDCLEKFVKFHWNFAVYCESSFFCGLGVDFGQDYSSETPASFLPLKEFCTSIVDPEKWSCDALEDTLYSAGILKKIGWTCSSGGMNYCRKNELKQCLDMEVGYICSDCIEGTKLGNTSRQCEVIDPYLSQWEDTCSCGCGRKRRYCIWYELNVEGILEKRNSSVSGNNPCNNELSMDYTGNCSSDNPCIVTELRSKTGTHAWAPAEGNFSIALHTLDGNVCDVGILNVPNISGRIPGQVVVYPLSRTCDVCISNVDTAFDYLSVQSLVKDIWGPEYIEVTVNGFRAKYTSTAMVNYFETRLFWRSAE